MRPYLDIKFLLQDGGLPIEDVLRMCMRFMHEANVAFYRANPKAPRVLSVCRFTGEDPNSNKETFKTAAYMIREQQLYAMGLCDLPLFDCEDFTCAESAYLEVRENISCYPDIMKDPNSNRLHAFVRIKEDGSKYDPSKLAGMLGDS